MTISKAVVLGLGSIGLRHAEVLEELGLDVIKVSRRPALSDVSDLSEIDFQEQKTLVLISNETSQHVKALHDVLAFGHKGMIVVEKPLSVSYDDVENLDSAGASVYVAYNLRFLPVIEALKKCLDSSDEQVLSVQAYVGQNLKTWRTGRQPEETYSAHKDLGGGVLRDLSHELDLVNWLVGPISRVVASGGRKGQITVDSDDCWNILMENEKGTAISLGLNYYDNVVQRAITVITNSHTYVADLVEGTLNVDGEKTLYQHHRNTSYLSMWKNVISEGMNSKACCFEDAKHIMKLIQSCESSVLKKEWVEL